MILGVTCRFECARTRPSARMMRVGGHRSGLRPRVAAMHSLIKFRVEPESTRATTVLGKPISETDRWTSFDEKRDTEVRSQAVLKSPTSEGLGTGSFPGLGSISENGPGGRARGQPAALYSGPLLRLTRALTSWGNRDDCGLILRSTDRGLL